MTNQLLRRSLAMFLSIVLLFSCFPTALATEGGELSDFVQETTEATEPEETTEATEAEETTEATEAEETTEATEAEETTEATEAEETTEATEAEETTEATEAEETTEATEAEETTEATEAEETTEATEAVEEIEETLPYGLTGLPEGYTLSEEEIATKAEMSDYDVVEDIDGLKAGTDFVPRQILVEAESEEEAQIYATAFNGTLEQYIGTTAVIRLSGVTVAQAVTASADMAINLPAAYPNYITYLDPAENILVEEPVAAIASDLPEEEEWIDWYTTSSNPDPYMKDPYSVNYQYMHDVVDSYAAWAVTTGDPSIKVAVIDTGVRASHEDFGGRVKAINIGYGTGDVQGHGTHVAGIIAASLDNGKGGAGIAPNVSILSICAYNTRKGGFLVSDTINALHTAANNGAHIINMSLGGPNYNASYKAAITRTINRGVTIVAAMGNDGTNVKNYPAAYPGVIAVGSTDRANQRSVFSNYGPWCDVTAPGTGIMSTLYNSNNTSYGSKNGTSMACPVVAGVCALYMSAKGYQKPAAMEKALKAGTTKCVSSGMGKGIVNIANMLDTKPAAPTYNAGGYTSYKAGTTLSSTATLKLYNAADDDSAMILYSTNGKAPSIKNGAIVNGQEYTGAISLTPFAGKTVTVKAITVSGLGIPGAVRTLKLKVAENYVVQKVTGITIKGADAIAPGSSATYTATVTPATADNKGITWSLQNAPAGVTITAKGKVTVPASVTSGYFYVVARSNDGNKTVTKTVRVDSKCTGVILKAVGLYKGTVTKTNTQGSVTGLRVFSTDLPETDAQENKFSLQATLLGTSSASDVWSSSNPGVASVDSNGYVTAHKAGTAKITCKASDNSGKSATVTVTVQNPVSTMSIRSSMPISKNQDGSNNNIYFIAFGKTAKNTVSFATTYGVPSNKKVTWDFTVAEYYNNGDYRRSFTSTAKSLGLISVNASGKLTVKKDLGSKLQDDAGYFLITVKATAQDGTGRTATVKYLAIKPITKIKVWKREGSSVYFFTSAPRYVYNGYPQYPLTISSSNPNVAAGNAIRYYRYGTIKGKKSWGYGHVWVVSVAPSFRKGGTSKITLKAADGTGKKASRSVRMTRKGDS